MYFWELIVRTKGAEGVETLLRALHIPLVFISRAIFRLGIQQMLMMILRRSWIGQTPIVMLS